MSPLRLASIAVPAFTSFVLAALLMQIAYGVPPDPKDPLRHTNLYFLSIAARTPKGRRLVRWFWLSQLALGAAIFSLVFHPPE